MKILITTIFFFSVFLSNAAAGAYKWVDEEGNVHYSQSKPTGHENLKEIKPPPKLEISETESAAETEKNSEPASELKEEAGTETLSESERKNKNCETSRQLLEKLLTTRRLRVPDEDGGHRFASDEEYSGKVEKIQSNIKKWCK